MDFMENLKGDEVMRIESEIKTRELLTAIGMYIEEHGYSPTIRELGDMMEIKSTATVHKYLKRLKGMDKIEWNPTMPRTIVLK